MPNDNTRYLFAALDIPRSESWDILNRDGLTKAQRLVQLCMASESVAIRKIGERLDGDHFAVYEGNDYKAMAIIELFDEFVDGFYITDDSGDFLRVVLKL